MQRQSSCDGASSSRSSPQRGRLVFTMLAALAHTAHASVPVSTADQWLSYGAMLPPPRADVDAALAASALALRTADADADYCSACRARQRQRQRQQHRGGSAQVNSVPDGDNSRCARCAAGAQVGGCLPVLRRRRRVSPKPVPPST